MLFDRHATVSRCAGLAVNCRFLEAGSRSSCTSVLDMAMTSENTRSSILNGSATDRHTAAANAAGGAGKQRTRPQS